MFSDVFPVLGVIIFASLIIIGVPLLFSAAVHMIASARTRNLVETIQLPEGSRWDVNGKELSLVVDVNHGTGSDPQWVEAMNAFRSGYADNKFSYPTAMFPKEFLDTSNEGIVTMARWMREQYINTDGFTTPVPFPVESRKWDIRHDDNHEDMIVVNGINIEKTQFGDNRDVIAAMIGAYPLIEKRERIRIENERKNRAIEQVANAVPALTTREHKDASMDAVKKQYLS
jgi:hypothetical protein